MTSLTIKITHNLQLSDVPPELMEILTEKLEFINPKWLENERMGRWNRGTSKSLRFYDKIGDSGIWIPRGFMRQLVLLCRRYKIKYDIVDRRSTHPVINFSFKGKLRSFQQEAVDQMLARDFGTLSSATGSGKTIMALYMIAQRCQPTLIVVHTKELAAQWIERIESFLGISPEKIGIAVPGRQ